MSGRLLWRSLLGAAAALVAFPLLAHHSFSVFDMTSEKTIEGEVVEFEWTNPHTWTWVNVTNADGTVTEWVVQGRRPTILGSRAWTKCGLEPGDHVVITIYPLKSGEPGGTFLRATLADGTVKVMFGPGP